MASTGGDNPAAAAAATVAATAATVAATVGTYVYVVLNFCLHHFYHVYVDKNNVAVVCNVRLRYVFYR